MPALTCSGCGALLISANPAQPTTCPRCRTVRPACGPDRTSLSGLLRCDVCGRTEECRGGELFRYVQTRWPECCGDVMSLFLPAGKPRAERNTDSP